MFEILGYTYKDAEDLVGQSTFCLPDLRGRMALGRDNMDNRIQVLVGDLEPIDEFTVTTPAGRVNSDFAKILGSGGGASTSTLAIKNLPQHTHDMRGTDRQGRPGQFYYGVRNVAGTPDDEDAIPGVGGQAAGQAQYLGTAGRVVSTDGIGVPVDLMNPYLSINYIIYTGVTA